VILLVVLPLAGCTESSAPPAADAGPPEDTAPARPPADEVRGWLSVPTGLHVHSVHSHDACDDEPWIDGEPNAECTDDLRRGACVAGLRAVFLSDHASSMSEVPFSELWAPFYVR